MTDLTRRKFFIVSALAMGFAVAAGPISAKTIKTDTTGLMAGEVKIPVADGEIPAYHAMPAIGENFPIILVIQEIFGVHEYIQDVCRRLAKLGYLAIAPEMFARQGDVSKMSDIQEILSQVVSKVPDAQVMSDLDATVAWAVKSSKGNGDKIGITGFCWGGRTVWMYSAHSPQVKAGVAWYGLLASNSNPLTPKHPLDVAPYLKAPVLGLYAGKDEYIPTELVTKMQEILQAGDTGSEIILYPDVPHGFHADYRPTYRQEIADDGWSRMLAWFAKYGVN